MHNWRECEDNEEFTDTHEILPLASTEGEKALIAFDAARQAIIKTLEGKNRFKSRSSKAAIDNLRRSNKQFYNDQAVKMPKDKNQNPCNCCNNYSNKFVQIPALSTKFNSVKACIYAET